MRTYTRAELEAVVLSIKSETARVCGTEGFASTYLSGVDEVLRRLDALPNPPAGPERSMESKRPILDLYGLRGAVQRPRATTPTPEVPAPRATVTVEPDALRWSCNVPGCELWAHNMESSREARWAKARLLGWYVTTDGEVSCPGPCGGLPAEARARATVPEPTREEVLAALSREEYPWEEVGRYLRLFPAHAADLVERAEQLRAEDRAKRQEQRRRIPTPVPSVPALTREADGPGVVWESPGSIRVVGPPGAEHAEARGRDGEWYELNVGPWAYVLARALAQATREAAPVIEALRQYQHRDEQSLTETIERLVTERRTLPETAWRESADSMRERARAVLADYLTAATGATERAMLEGALTEIGALPLEPTG